MFIPAKGGKFPLVPCLVASQVLKSRVRRWSVPLLLRFCGVLISFYPCLLLFCCALLLKCNFFTIFFTS